MKRRPELAHGERAVPGQNDRSIHEIRQVHIAGAQDADERERLQRRHLASRQILDGFQIDLRRKTLKLLRSERKIVDQGCRVRYVRDV